MRANWTLIGSHHRVETKKKIQAKGSYWFETLGIRSLPVSRSRTRLSVSKNLESVKSNFLSRRTCYHCNRKPPPSAPISCPFSFYCSSVYSARTNFVFRSMRALLCSKCGEQTQMSNWTHNRWDVQLSGHHCKRWPANKEMLQLWYFPT